MPASERSILTDLPRVLVAPTRFGDGERLAGGWVRFGAVRLTIGGRATVVPLGQVRAAIAPLPAEVRAAVRRRCDALVARRAAVAGLDMARPHVMGIVNVTPDSFSDGALRPGGGDPVAAARAMAAAGASLIDIGGESTRPGAQDVPVAEELARVMPVLAALLPSRLREGPGVGSPDYSKDDPRTTPLPSPLGEGRETREARPGGGAVPGTGLRSTPPPPAPPLKGRGGSPTLVSIDTRKAAVMAAALDAGAALVNDVSALTHDPAAAALLAARGCPVVLMHAQGTPATMQLDPRYDDVVGEVFDGLEARIDAAVAAGIARDRIVADPGIGFGKTAAHNVALLRNLAAFHALGVPLLLGASRKALIARLARDEAPPAARLGGSLALALHGVACGVQIVRVHDVPETVQALRVAGAIA